MMSSMSPPANRLKTGLPQLLEKEKPLLSLLHQLSYIHKENVDAQELYAVYTLSLLLIYTERSVFSLPGPLVLDYDFLGLADIPDEIPPHQCVRFWTSASPH